MHLFLAVLFVATLANAMPLIKDGAWMDSLPRTLERGDGFALLDPQEADFIAAGWTHSTQEQMDARAEAQAQAAKAEYVAKIASVSEQAFVFRWVLQQHFGAGAETNHAVSEAAVSQYFISRRMAGTSADTDASDAILLQQGFSVLAQLTVDGTTWSFPWEMIP